MTRHSLGIPVQTIVFGLLLGWSTSALAQQIYIYPQKNQSAAQQAKDKAECQQWATQQTGFDPAAPPAAAPAAPAPQQGRAVRGAARGALAGAAIGAIAGDTGKGAAIGATAGGLRGVARNRDAMIEQEQAQQQQAATAQAQASEHRRAMTACLEGRGYTVK